MNFQRIWTALLLGLITVLSACGKGDKVPSELRIKAAPLASDSVTYALPCKVEDIELGARGRFLILHLKEERRLGVFDVNQSKITGFVPLASDDVTFTASATKLFVGLRDSGILLRYDLVTLEEELVAPVPISSPLGEIAIGAASDGPLLICGEGYSRSWCAHELVFVDPVTFADLGTKFFSNSPDRTVDIGKRRGFLVASAEGSLFGYWLDNHTFPGAASIVLDRGKNGAKLYHGFARGAITPAPDGTRIYARNGSWPPNFNDAFDEETSGLDRFISAAHGKYMLSPKIEKKTERDKSWPLEIHGGEDPKPLLTLDHAIVSNEALWHAHRSIFFIPDAKLIVTVGKERKELVLYRADCSKLPKVKAPKKVADPPPLSPYHIADKPVGPSRKAPRVKPWRPVAEASPLRSTTHSVEPQPQVIEVPDLGGKDHLSYPLPAAPRTVAVGGGGRFLIMYFPTLGKLGVFDVNVAKIVKLLPIGEPEELESWEPGTLIAAGMSKLLVADTKRGKLSRWDLTTFEQEKTVDLELNLPRWATMGSASEGPLVIQNTIKAHFDYGIHFFDIDTLEEVSVEFSEEDRLGKGSSLNTRKKGIVSGIMRASANGRMFTAQMTSGTPGGVHVFIRTGAKTVDFHRHIHAGFLLPGADGSSVFSENGIWTNESRRISIADLDKMSLFPAAQGDFFLGIRGTSKRDRSERTEQKVHLFVRGESRPLRELTGIKPIAGRAFQASMPVVDRVHFVPAAKLLIVNPPSGDSLELYRVDAEAALADARLLTPLVTSHPPVKVAVGEDYAYQIEAVWNRGKIASYELVFGPAGMKVDASGNLTWKASGSAGNHQVAIRIRTEDSRETFHSFDLEVIPSPAE